MIKMDTRQIQTLRLGFSQKSEIRKRPFHPEACSMYVQADHEQRQQWTGGKTLRKKNPFRQK